MPKVSSPGLTLPTNLRFNSFSKKKTSDLLLQSSSHPTIDYTATESKTSDAAEKHLRHYVAVFDPATKRLKVTAAKKMTVRSSVRQLQPDVDDEEANGEERTVPPQTPSSRAALTEAFGTKKSKKAVASVAENRLLASGGGNAENPLSNAILSALKDEDELDDFDNEIDLSTASRLNKPLPEANMSTNNIKDVYALKSLIFPSPPSTTLSQMPIAYWRDNVKSQKPVRSRSRFISNRVLYLAKAHLADPSNEQPLRNLQILRYILLLLEIHNYISRLPPRRPVPQPEQWPAKTTSDASLSMAFLARLTTHFLPTGIPTTHAKTLLTTTILALTLQIPLPRSQPNFLITEPTDIALDLALQPLEASKLYRELGCKMVSVNDRDAKSWGLENISKAGRKMVNQDGQEITVPKPKWAKLEFPIQFPKVSAGRPNRR